MTAIHDFGTSGSLSARTPAKNPEPETARDAAAPQSPAAESPPPTTGGRSDGTPLLSSAVQATLIANQAQPAPPAYVPSAALIAAADILAQDIVRALDSNHNGTLSKAEIAAVSPLAAWASDTLDTNRDGQLSANELANGILQGNVPLPL